MDDEIEKVETPDKKGYEVSIKKGDLILEILIDKSGKLLKKEDISGENKENSEAKENEVENEHIELEKFENSEKKMILLGYRQDFNFENLTFSIKGRKKYFILELGYQLVLEGKDAEKVHFEVW